MRKTIIVLASTAAFASPAMAQEAPSFTGFRIEALGGYDNLGADVDEDDSGRQSIDGTLYGVGAGFDVGFGPAVVGVEAELSDSLAKRNLGSFYYDDGVDAFDLEDVRLKTGRDLYVGVRAGFQPTPGLLLYGKAGYTNAKVKVSGVLDGDAGSISGKMDGLRLGGGLEAAVTKNVFVKFEYRYSKYKNLELNFGDDEIDADDVLDDVDVTRHQGVVGFGFRF